MIKNHKKALKIPKIAEKKFESCFTFCTFKLFLPKKKFAHLQIGP